MTFKPMFYVLPVVLMLGGCAAHTANWDTASEGRKPCCCEKMKDKEMCPMMKKQQKPCCNKDKAPKEMCKVPK